MLLKTQKIKKKKNKKRKKKKRTPDIAFKIILKGVAI